METDEPLRPGVLDLRTRDGSWFLFSLIVVPRLVDISYPKSHSAPGSTRLTSKLCYYPTAIYVARGLDGFSESVLG